MAAQKNRAHEHIKAVAVAAQRILRLKDELAIAKGNLKLAETDFNIAVREMQDFASEQLAFDLGPATASS